MLRAFEAKAAAYEQLQKLSRNDFVVNCISYYFWNLGVYRALSRSQAHYAVSFANPVPIFKKVRLHILKRALGNLIRFRRSDSKFFVLWKKLGSLARSSQWPYLSMNLPPFIPTIFLMERNSRCPLRSIMPCLTGLSTILSKEPAVKWSSRPIRVRTMKTCQIILTVVRGLEEKL